MDDDLYQNAWSETTNSIPPALKDDPAPSWTSTKLTSSYGEEADLAAPSWSTGAGIHWNEPSSPGFSWSQTEPDLAWGTSSYAGISIGKTPEAESIADPLDAKSPTGDIPDADEPEDEDAGSVSTDVPTSERAKSPSPSPPPPESTSFGSQETTPELAAPPSPDGFGSFETAFTEDTAQSPGFALDEAVADPWGSSAWSETQPEQEEEPVDEWERARQEKAKQDRRVPPELLAQFLQQCEELGREFCPDTGKEAATESWSGNWRSGMDGVPGLNALMDSFLPPLTLKASVRFPQTVVAKRLASSVKLTKNLPLTKGSPMSHYLAAKGSTAWETSVKEQKEIVEDDIPVGWRIMEKTMAASSADAANQKKPTGRLFSFWGRRQSQASPQSTSTDGAATESRPSSVDKPRSPVVEEVKADSRPPSQNSIRSSTASNRAPVSPLAAESASASSSHVPMAFAATVTPAAAGAPTMSSYASSPDPVPERSASPPAPTVMSRFLNRFSRRGSGIGGSPRSSLALSSDDLEFLSDIIPSASDDADEDPTDALEKFVNDRRGSVASALPPALAPPPRASAIKPMGVASGPPSAGSDRGVASDGFAGMTGFWGANEPAVASRAAPAGGQTSIPTLPPPLVPSRPITPSATPGAGPSRVSIPVVPTSFVPSSRPPSRLQTSTPPLSGFALPPPPSFQRSASSNTSTMTNKPKLSSPFPLPIPPPSHTVEREPSSASTSSSRASFETAAEASPSPTSPTSSLPLGSLYPHLVTPTSPPLASSQPMLPAQSSSSGSSSPYGLATPMASTFSAAAPPPNPSTVTLVPPQQSRPMAPPSAVPLTTNFFDDDDFADFQSPVDKSLSPPVPPPIAKSPQTRVPAMSLAGKSKTVAPNSSPFSFPGPPPPQASPSSATALKPASLASSTSSLFPTSVSNQALLTPKHNSGFDDMGDFFASTLRTPSPPRVPSKSPAAKPQIAPLPPSASSVSSMPSASSSSSLLSRRKPNAAQHLHTLSLVEAAAARKGQWPAPASPLPQAIPGPFVGSAKASQMNLMDADETPLPVAGLGITSSFSSPAMLNPTRPSSGMGVANGTGLPTSVSSNSSLSGALLQGWDFQGSGASQPAPDIFGGAAKPANGKPAAGGLSAQDLSFFEGL
ncbi:uncharacterized protein TRAVEDRAFT_72219 [Trametes versicolor FP-101664 SS1]|uniref:uncharacterized protein n=1 Tax=Trametes versicolor (strain FP-101664) TaxID=717944 RepID=UPI000462345A|nr:uncharacterized protein TRAVEDRAFT_72219 [Trametes versicolor FP-101664 SS1]EIW58735.1 hypothetical protein TRAVEDRAFT_72219 [Trametes versicolor FP-101664 SS1]